MYIRKTTKTHKGKTYTNYLLVESVQTPKGPRQRIICSLGSLSPGPAELWHSLARKVQGSLEGQLSFEPANAQVDSLVGKARTGRKRPGEPSRGHKKPSEVLTVHTERVALEGAREAGPVHVGHQVWRQLGLEEILSRAGLSERARLVSEAMSLNRLIFPLSEHAMPEWIGRTALGDIVGADLSTLNDDALYRNLDRLYANRERIERELAEREKTLFNLEETVYLYDLTSTYFEGQALSNPQAKRGYSRDKRPDCKQVLVGLVLDQEGFPKAHEVFEGNRQDRSTVEEMLQSLERRTGKKVGSTVVVDRGMADEETLEQIRAHELHYIVAGQQSERNLWLEEFEKDGDWEEVMRASSPRNPAQQKSRVWIKRGRTDNELCILCLSEGRQEKDRAIRETQERRLLRDLQALKTRIEKGHLKNPNKIHQAIGRLKERYPRVARYYRMEYDAQQKSLSWHEETDKKAIAHKLDGSYVLKTDRQDLTAGEIWRTYSGLRLHATTLYCILKL